jgi:hypothetical protein
VILLAPFGTTEVRAAEAVLFEFIKAELKVEQPQLIEHRDYGLPRLDEWLGLLEAEGIAARAYPTGYLHAWLGMMLIKHLLMRADPGLNAQWLVDSYYNHSFFPTERREPAYRHLIIAEKTPGLVAAVDAVLAPTIMPSQADANADWGSALLPVMLTIVQRQLGVRHEQTETHYQQQIGYYHAQIDHYHAQIDHYRAQVSSLERVLADQQIMINQMEAHSLKLQEQAVMVSEHSRQRGEAYEAAMRDLTERAHWLEGQTVALRRQLEAVQHGRVMRVLNALSGRK